jgi:hypothetical protein
VLVRSYFLILVRDEVLVHVGVSEECEVGHCHFVDR